MAVVEGEFRPPPVAVSITDGRHQVQFDTLSDMLDWLPLHPEVAERHWDWHWTVLPLGESLESRVEDLEAARYAAD